MRRLTNAMTTLALLFWSVSVDAGEPTRTVTEFAKITASDGIPGAFGASIAVSGDDLVVGAPGYITKEGVVGAAYVFRRSGPRWIETAQLFPQFGGMDGEDFGLSVAIDGDLIVVGAPHIIGGQIGGGYGRAFIFRRQDPGTPHDPFDDLWWQDAHLMSPDELRWGDNFGMSVAVSDGAVLIGRPGWDFTTGSAYIYRRVSDVWVHDASLNPSDSRINDDFGGAVSLNGSLALVGARNYDGASYSGAAYIFGKTEGVWLEEGKLSPSDPAFLGDFGRSVCLSDRYAVVGAQFKAYVYGEHDGWWGEEQLTVPGSTNDFALRVASDSDVILSSDTNGIAHLFCRDGNAWTHCRKLTTSVGAQLGFRVAVGDTYAFVNGSYETVYVYVTPRATKNLRDFAAFQTCFSNQQSECPTECEQVDLVPDGWVNLVDFDEFLATFAGP